MYVVLTLAELTHYASWNFIEHIVNDDPRSFDPEYVNVPAEVLDACELTLSEEEARKCGILAPRGEKWIANAWASGFFEGKVPRVKTPEIRLRGYPSEVSKTTLGTPCELRTQAEAPECDDPLPF